MVRAVDSSRFCCAPRVARWLDVVAIAVSRAVMAAVAPVWEVTSSVASPVRVVATLA